MKEELVCVDLNALYGWAVKSKARMCDVYSDYAECEHCIIRNKIDTEYFDLYSDKYSGLRLCCDGEQCKVLERTADYVKLIDVENIDNEELRGIDTTFKLSIAEFNIATKG